jgi:hypothetical protein
MCAHRPESVQRGPLHIDPDQASAWAKRGHMVDAAFVQASATLLGGPGDITVRQFIAAPKDHDDRCRGT